MSYSAAKSIASHRRYIKKNHLTYSENKIAYLHFRLLRPFLKLYQKHLLKKWRNSPIPWMTPAAIDILQTLLTKNMSGFEFGSGRSTLFIAPRVKELVSLEHDQQWFAHIEAELKKKKLGNVHYVHILPANDASKTIGYPKNNYENYVMPATPATCVIPLTTPTSINTPMLRSILLLWTVAHGWSVLNMPSPNWSQAVCLFSIMLSGCVTGQFMNNSRNGKKYLRLPVLPILFSGLNYEKLTFSDYNRKKL